MAERERPGCRPLEQVVVNRGLYVDGRRQPDETSIERSLKLARQRGGFVWIAVVEPSEAEFSEITSVFDLPSLAVEDAVRAHQRPKLERYGDITFVVMKPVRYIDSDEIVEVSEVALFVSEHFVVSVRHGASSLPARVRSALEETEEHLLRHGPSAVLYHMADEIVDEYADVIDEIEVDIDQIEADVFSGDSRDHSQRIYQLKREVLEFRRAVAPLVHVTEQLTSELTLPVVASEIREHFRDVHDHVLRAADAIEGYDSLLTDVLQAGLAQISVRLNQVAARQNADMRKISSWAAIALVPTAIAGIYGMNFEHLPGLDNRYGYVVVLGIIAAACFGLYLLLRRRRWL